MSQSIKMTLAVDAAREYIAAAAARREAERQQDAAEKRFLGIMNIQPDDYLSRAIVADGWVLTYHSAGINALTPLEWPLS